MKILAFNTVTELCSVAMMIDQKIYNHNIIAPRLHAEKILPMIDRLLIDSGVTLRSFDCIVFDRGPGSFIGLRIGINVAQGLALGADLPLVGVSSLKILAQGAYRMFSAKNVITTINANMNELYWNLYSYDMIHNHWRCQHDIQLATTSIIQKIIYTLDGSWVIVGTGWDSDKKIKSYIENSNVITQTQIMYPDAVDMLYLGIRFYKEKNFLSPNSIIPLYITQIASVKKNNNS